MSSFSFLVLSMHGGEGFPQIINYYDLAVCLQRGPSKPFVITILGPQRVLQWTPRRGVRAAAVVSNAATLDLKVKHQPVVHTGGEATHRRPLEILSLYYITYSEKRPSSPPEILFTLLGSREK